MNPYPFYSRHFRKLLKQFTQCPFAIQVKAIVSRVLCYEYKFLYTGCGKTCCLCHEILHRNRPVCTSDERNCTVGTPSVASFGNLQIRIREFLPGNHSLIPPVMLHLTAESLDNRFNVTCTIPSVNFRDETRHVGNVSL